MLIRQYVLEGLGHLSAMLADEDSGVAVVVDPRRDVDVYVHAAAERDLRITHVLETHVHNDYVSGARELAALARAQHVIGAGAGLEYEHRAVRDGESLRVGALEIVARATPGHTPEHVVYAAADASRAGEPTLLLSGGSLLVGSVGRADLLGPETAEPLARAMYESLRSVVFAHADYVTVMPTHGAGSLCSAGTSSTPSSTIGYERRHNEQARLALESDDAEPFVRALLAGQPTIPAYFSRMRPTNQAGPTPFGLAPPPPVAVEPARAAADLAAGALVVDLRDPLDHAVGHVPGSVSIPADSSFGTWLGWTVEPDRPLLLLLPNVAAWDDAIRQAARVGLERSVVGYLHGGLDAWIAAGQPVEMGDTITVTELGARLGSGDGLSPFVIDVRQGSEYERGHVPGSVHIGAGELADRLSELPRDRPLATICASGYRASVAASLLRRAGFTNVSSVAAGVPAWHRAGGRVQRGRMPGELTTERP